MIFSIKVKSVILTHTMHCCLLLLIYSCYFWQVLCSRVTYLNENKPRWTFHLPFHFIWKGNTDKLYERFTLWGECLLKVKTQIMSAVVNLAAISANSLLHTFSLTAFKRLNFIIEMNCACASYIVLSGHIWIYCYCFI